MDTNQTTLNDLTDDEFNQLVNFQPTISDEQRIEMEEGAKDEVRGIQRRLCLLTCARSEKELSGLRLKEPEAFAEMMESIEAFKDHAEALAEVAEAAYNRMVMANFLAECPE